jgi:hypothetical protein
MICVDDQLSPCASVVSLDQGVQDKKATNALNAESNPYDVANDTATYEDLNEGGYYHNTSGISGLSVAGAHVSSNVYENGAVCCAEFR